MAAGFGGNGGGGGRGKDAAKAEASPEANGTGGGGGGGGGGGTAEGSSSAPELDDDAPAEVLAEGPDNGILGPIDDLNIGGFPGGGAPVGLRVGWKYTESSGLGCLTLSSSALALLGGGPR